MINHDLGVSIVMGVSKKMVGLFHLKSPLQMDDDWGYAYFRKPPKKAKTVNTVPCGTHLNLRLDFFVYRYGQDSQARKPTDGHSMCFFLWGTFVQLRPVVWLL